MELNLNALVSRQELAFNESILEQKHKNSLLEPRFAPPCVSPLQNPALPFIVTQMLLPKVKKKKKKTLLCWVGSPKPVLYSMEDLKEMTDNFSQRNFIGQTLFTKLYRGTIRESWLPFESWDVTVKIWDYNLPMIRYVDPHGMLQEEVMFLTEPSVKRHPNVVNLIGYCNRAYFEGIVYDLNPLDTVHNLTTTGSLTWLQRIKVALGFARVLEFLHDPKMPYLVRNIDAAHIILDQDYDPKIFDFSTMSGGILGKLTRLKDRLLTIGYDDPTDFPLGGPEEGGFEVTYHDVFSYGVVLLGLIAKRIVDKEDTLKPLVYDWAWKQYMYRPNCSLVHESLVEDPGFYASDGKMITELAMRCIQRELDKRPTMKDVVKHLEGLQAIQPK